MIPPLFPFLAEATTAVDPTLTSLVSLLGTLGPTAGAIVVLWLCLDRMNRDQKETREWVGGLIGQLKADGERRELAIRDVVNQQGELMREFSRSSNGICRYAGPAPAPRRNQA